MWLRQLLGDGSKREHVPRGEGFGGPGDGVRSESCASEASSYASSARWPAVRAIKGSVVGFKCIYGYGGLYTSHHRGYASKRFTIQRVISRCVLGEFVGSSMVV